MPPTNNEAERALRPLVVLRKITFGHRSDAGAVRMARLMTVAETAKRHSHRPSDIYYRVFTRSLGQVLQRLDDGSERRLLSVGDQSLGRYASSVFPGFFFDWTANNDVAPNSRYVGSHRFVAVDDGPFQPVCGRASNLLTSVGAMAGVMYLPCLAEPAATPYLYGAIIMNSAF